MTYDFDRKVDRKSTNDMKWHAKAVSMYLHREIPETMIPMWLADTEFACPPCIVKAVEARAAKEIFGYCAPMESYYAAVCGWQKRRHNWDVSPAWVTQLPSVVAGINIAIRAFSQPGDGVIIQQPVYDPFATIVQQAGRVVVNNALVETGHGFEMNFDELAQLAAKLENKIMVLCSPHNPVGRVWKEEELRRVADICAANDVLLVCDEIHSDIVYTGHRHIPILALDEKYSQKCILLNAPGKTFNVAGLKSSYSIIPSEELRKAFNAMQVAMSLDVKNTFGLEGTIAAYTDEGEEWMEQELAYLEQNMAFASEFVEKNMPGAKLPKPEGTFLGWLDLRGLGLSDEELFRRIVLEAAVICVPGGWFGPGGEGHIRLNAGCPRAMLQEALERIRDVLYKK